MSPDLLKALVDFVRDDATCSALLTGFCLGLTVGLAVSRFTYRGICAVYRIFSRMQIRRRKRKAEEEQRREDAAKRRLESCRARHAEEARRAFIAERIARHIASDGYVVTDLDGSRYCMACFNRESIARLVVTGHDMLICPECGGEEPVNVTRYFMR